MTKSIVVVAFLAAATAQAQTNEVESQIEAMYAARLQRFQSAPTPEAMADAYVTDVSEDAIWMPQGGSMVRGKAGVRAWAVWFFSTWVLEISGSEFEPMLVGADVAVRRWVTTGTYVERSSGRRIPFSQKYVDVLKRADDGSWKLASHMWSSNDRDPSIWSEP